MPALSNPKHEAFAQALAKGEPAEHAYVSAGYARNSANAIRLKGNERVKARVAELSEKAAEKTLEVISFEAKAQFERIQAIVAKAIEAGDLKVALEGQKFIAKCFGYEDNPTLTHEHVTGRTLPQIKQQGDDDQDAPQERMDTGPSASAVTQALREFRTGRPN